MGNYPLTTSSMEKNRRKWLIKEFVKLYRAHGYDLTELYSIAKEFAVMNISEEDSDVFIIIIRKISHFKDYLLEAPFYTRKRIELNHTGIDREDEEKYNKIYGLILRERYNTIYVNIILCLRYFHEHHKLDKEEPNFKIREKEFKKAIKSLSHFNILHLRRIEQGIEQSIKSLNKYKGEEYEDHLIDSYKAILAEINPLIINYKNKAKDKFIFCQKCNSFASEWTKEIDNLNDKVAIKLNCGHINTIGKESYYDFINDALSLRFLKY